MIYIMIIALLFGLDSVIKYKIEKNTNTKIIKEIFNKRVIIQKYHNRGAVFELFSQKSREVAIISFGFVAFILGIFVATFGTKGNLVLKTGLALILGGAFSNTYDIISKKYVVDYLSFKVNSKYKILKRFENIVFNISDFSIIIGSMFLVLSQIKDAK